jgi:hypothetical protein
MRLSRIIDGEICFSEKEAFNLYVCTPAAVALHAAGSLVGGSAWRRQCVQGMPLWTDVNSTVV